MLGVTAQVSPESLHSLQYSENDPEVKPGLFQGDMALTSEVVLFLFILWLFDIDFILCYCAL